MADTSRAVFLSYASQDAGAAQRICEALRSGGIEVWFDQSELRGGDAWDQKIRRELHDCALFIPVISANTAARHEGYFRLEWDLADQRTHMIARNRAFIVPVCVDATPETSADAPESFQRVQWTRLPGGEAPAAFVKRIQRLLNPEDSPVAAAGATIGPTPAPSTGRSPLTKAVGWCAGAIAAIAVAYFIADKFWFSKHSAPPSLPTSPVAQQTGPPAGTTAAFNPPSHSIAVLPFVNMSGDKDQEYFSDGLTEEVLNSLARINELQVAARTSAFSFKGKDTDIGTIARKLNVGAILEGSVRRYRQRIRITAQLNNAVTGFYSWSQTYDRDLSDVLALQTEIATAVASALKVTLLGDVAAKVEVGGTRNPQAFDAYLRASKARESSQSDADVQTAIAAYTEAIRLDPAYALAYADRSLAIATVARDYATGLAIRDSHDKAQADARKAIALAPELAEGHLALASLLEDDLQFAGALEEYQRALALEPGNARLLRRYAWFAVDMGHTEAGLAAVRRSVVLDPLNSNNQLSLGTSLLRARHYGEAIEALTHAQALAPNDVFVTAWLGFAYYASGDFQRARTTCESIRTADNFNRRFCLALTYNKLGRRTDAESALAELRASSGDESALFYAMIYSQWGDSVRALDWLEEAMRRRDPYLEYVKTNRNFDPLRQEPRFQAIERALKFPD